MDDFDAIQSMAVSFFLASPYAPLGVDKERVSELITAFLTAKPEDKIVLLWIDEKTNKPVGVMGATAEMNIFNYYRFACELMWWINPEHRKTKAASKMLQAYEFWARKIGCQSCSLIDVMGNLDTYYKRKGYERRETTYLKEF
jgi:hypothetical protein